MVMERQLTSVDSFLQIVEHADFEDRVVELIEGEIVDMHLPNPIHAAVLITLSTALQNYATQSGLGRVLGGDVPFILERNADGRGTLRGLDIAYLSTGRYPGNLPRLPFEIALDLAVEIISPGNKAEDIEKKIEQLLEAGANLVWIVYPDLRRVAVHSQASTFKRKESDTLTGGDVLPGFEIRCGDIFPS